MKLLLDSCLSGKAAESLRASGHEVVWVGDWPADPGDAAILGQAWEEGCIVVTLDKDFGELAVVHGKSHSGIIRLVDCSVARQAATCELVLERHGGLLVAGGIVTAEPGRLRVRPANDASPA
jgi:predicted nuclease of predicted toxin-antitoxin system